MIRRLVIFGASGDLMVRYLIPACAELYAAGLLPDEFRILGVARDDWGSETFRCYMAEKLKGSAVAEVSAHEAMLARLDYCTADVSRPPAVASALAPLAEPVVVYLALPPAVFAPNVAGLGSGLI